MSFDLDILERQELLIVYTGFSLAKTVRQLFVHPCQAAINDPNQPDAVVRSTSDLSVEQRITFVLIILWRDYSLSEMYKLAHGTNATNIVRSTFGVSIVRMAAILGMICRQALELLSIKDWAEHNKPMGGERVAHFGRVLTYLIDGTSFQTSRVFDDEAASSFALTTCHAVHCTLLA